MHFSKTILKNGLRLIVVPMKESPTVTVMTLVEAGSKYEMKEQNGISHFLEHLCFKGTTKRPKPIDIVKELDGIGAHYNAFTGQEVTGYFAKSDKKHFAKILDVVSDIYLHSTLPPAEIEKEKGVIVEEIKMYQDLPPRRIHEVLMTLLYGDQPAGWEIAGSEASVRALSRAEISRYRGEHYLSGATAVIVAGAVTETEAERRVGEAFAGMQSGEKRGKAAVTEVQKAPALQIDEKKTDQVHLALGLRTTDLYHKDTPILRVASAVLGGGMSSRLFQKMRDELGICYYIGAAAETFTDHGFLEINAGVPAVRLAEALAAILAEVRRIRDEAVPADELARVKEYLTGSLYLGLESSDSLAEFYGTQESMQKPIKTPSEVAAEIQRVEAKEIARIARQYFTSDRLNLALIGSVENRESVLRGLHL